MKKNIFTAAVLIAAAATAIFTSGCGSNTSDNSETKYSDNIVDPQTEYDAYADMDIDDYCVEVGLVCLGSEILTTGGVTSYSVTLLDTEDGVICESNKESIKERIMKDLNISNLEVIIEIIPRVDKDDKGSLCIRYGERTLYFSDEQIAKKFNNDERRVDKMDANGDGLEDVYIYNTVYNGIQIGIFIQNEDGSFTDTYICCDDSYLSPEGAYIYEGELHTGIYFEGSEYTYVLPDSSLQKLSAAGLISGDAPYQWNDKINAQLEYEYMKIMQDEEDEEKDIFLIKYLYNVDGVKNSVASLYLKYSVDYDALSSEGEAAPEFVLQSVEGGR